ncbi:MAG: OmpH family outer membrane protein [Desulfatiglandales bacterium]
MKLFRRLIPAVLILFFFCGNAWADSRIGLFDLDKFQKKSVRFQQTIAAMKQKANDMQAKLDQEKAAADKLEDEFEKQRMMLSLDSQEDKRLALEKKKRYVKYLFEDFTFEMKAAEMEVSNRLNRELGKIVDEIGAKEGYTLILEKRALGLVYYNSAIDITDQVTKIYDSRKP